MAAPGNEPLTIIGITRFSMVTPDSVGRFKQTRRKTFDEVCRIIFDPERLDGRMRLFDAFALPTIRHLAARYDRYAHIIVTSKLLPSEWTDGLRERVEAEPKATVLALSAEDRAWPAIRARAAQLSGLGRVFTFRFDDDDALCASYIDLVLAEASRVAPNTAFSIRDGFLVRRVGADRLQVMPASYRTNAQGLGFFAVGPNAHTAYDLGNHNKIEAHVPLACVAGKPGWLRTLHGHSDMALGLEDGSAISEAEAKALLSDHFPHLDLERGLAAL